MDLAGQVLGHHEGIIHYTVGQRKGLRLAVGEPLYVIRLEPDTARVVVGPRQALATTRIRLHDLNWLGDAAETGAQPVAARVRSTREPRPALLTRDPQGGTAEIVLATPEDGVSPGQACVIYADDGPRARVLGGGTSAAVDALATGTAEAA